MKRGEMLTICGFAVLYACAPPPPPATNRAATSEEDEDDDKNKSSAATPPAGTAAATPAPVDAGTTTPQACTDPGTSRACATTCAGLERCIRQPSGALQWGT
jgi:hypothetical protein